MAMRIGVYLGLFVALGILVVFGFDFFFSRQQQPDWVLVGVYAFLATLTYYFFIVNDLNAKKLNGRAMAMSFFICYLALSLVAISFAYQIPSNLVWYVSGMMLIIGYSMGAYGVTKWGRYHKKVKKVMIHENLTDDLTGLFNRRAFAINSNRELDFCLTSGSDFSVIMLDIDDFKEINDRYGHVAGDEVLKQLSALINSFIRRSDSVYRWGGEEFVVLLPITGLFEAHQVANKIVKIVAEHTFIINQNLKINLTVSLGVAQWVRQESLLNDTLNRADKALYKAKSNGKNAVVVANYKDHADDVSKKPGGGPDNQLSA
ncbi:GGDEF domain-containing protein [Marinicella sediminis]|nr:GGDEF domain-containing protein [Marinicella sediminis]